MQTELSSDERRIILMALVHPVFRGAVNEHGTPKQVRDVYHALVERLQKDEQLHMALAKSVEPRLVIPRGKK